MYKTEPEDDSDWLCPESADEPEEATPAEAWPFSETMCDAAGAAGLHLDVHDARALLAALQTRGLHVVSERDKRVLSACSKLSVNRGDAVGAFGKPAIVSSTAELATAEFERRKP